ncbi:hypothetical protein [Saccharopolyspora sp. 5N708]|uniref:hypothetical protein n=1 Tax=Saccharopolyspora sp. 5N708 TaxID=3457424 RepID=UPI003FD4F794
MLADRDRGFDAIVVGEYVRPFSDNQFAHMLPLFDGYGVQVWFPEAGGPLQSDSPDLRALMAMLGAQSQREVLQARHQPHRDGRMH